MAAGAAAQKQHAETQIKQCAAAVDNMQWNGLGMYGQCYKKADANCKSSMDASNQMSPEIAKSCNARVVEFCKRYQTQEGFLKAKGDENAAQMCGVTTASIKEAQCPKAAQSESLAFLGSYCPVEAKPIAQQHCAGRDYTSKMGGKYGQILRGLSRERRLREAPPDHDRPGEARGQQRPRQAERPFQPINVEGRPRGRFPSRRPGNGRRGSISLDRRSLSCQARWRPALGRPARRASLPRPVSPS